MIEILIGGDVCPIGRNEHLFKEADKEKIFNDLLPEIEGADCSIVNLECPLIEEETPILKEGPIHAVGSDCIKGIKSSGIDVLNLANNHIFDHGSKGLMNTLRICRENGISTVGADENLESAGKMLIKDIKGIRVGILGVTEHEFSIAGKDTPGANPMDVINVVRTIKNRRGEYDFLIILVHSGAEGYPLPSPKLREMCRFMAEMGANAVICQHSHCPGTYETYLGASIVYGQGNLIFDEMPDPDSHWNRGFLVKLTIENNCAHEMDIIPYFQAGKNPGARKMGMSETDAFKKKVREASGKIADTEYIENKWAEICEERKSKYFYQILFGFLNSNRIFRRINSIFPFGKYFYTRKHLTLLENMIRCETHREAIEHILEKDRKNMSGTDKTK